VRIARFFSIRKKVSKKIYKQLKLLVAEAMTGAIAQLGDDYDRAAGVAG
jgi:hypothetical protein